MTDKKDILEKISPWEDDMKKEERLTIARVLKEFLEDQRRRLSPKTFSQYRSIVDLYRGYLQGYWPGHDDDEYSEEPGKTYVDRYGPEDIVYGFDEFLGYYMPRKVAAGQDTTRAAGTVTRKLAAWLVDRGYIEKDDDASKRLARKGKALASCNKAESLLEEAIDMCPLVDEKNILEDHFLVERIEPGRLWLEPLSSVRAAVGPVLVPEQASALLHVGADIGGRVGKRGKAWYIVELWSVSP